jgi:flotillin
LVADSLHICHGIWGVLPVKTIEFMDLRDSPKSMVIANIMAKEQSRIEKESRVRVAENKRSAELAEIDAHREVDVQRQDAEQQVGLRVAEKEKVVGIANEQAQQEIKVSAKTTAEREMEVKKVTQVRGAEIDRDVAVVKAEQDKKVKVVNAEAEKEALVVSAEGDKQSRTVRAEGDLQAALKDAEGIRARGEANASAEQAMLMAPVVTQIKLAEEIGANEGYQQYLVTIEQVKASRDVGLEMARAMQQADLKVIANGGDIQQGIGKLTDLFTPAGGTSLTGMLSALAQSPEGASLVKGLSSRLAGTGSSTN